MNRFPAAIRIVNGWLEILAGGFEVKRAKVVASTTGATPLVAAVAGKKIRVLGYRLQARAVNGAVVNAGFVDSTGAAISTAPDWDLNPREGVVAEGLPVGYEFETPVGTGLQANLSGNQAVMYHVIYCEV